MHGLPLEKEISLVPLFLPTFFRKTLLAIIRIGKFPVAYSAQGLRRYSDWSENPSKKLARYISVRVLRRPVIRPDVQLLRLAIVAEGGD